MGKNSVDHLEREKVLFIAQIQSSANQLFHYRKMPIYSYMNQHFHKRMKALLIKNYIPQQSRLRRQHYYLIQKN